MTCRRIPARAGIGGFRSNKNADGFRGLPPDSLHLGQFPRACKEDGLDAAEAFQQAAGPRGAYAWEALQDKQLPAATTDRAVSMPADASRHRTENLCAGIAQQLRGFAGVACAQASNPEEKRQCQKRTLYGLPAHSSDLAGNGMAFHYEDGPEGGSGQLLALAEQAAVYDRSKEIRCRLSFEQDAVADKVVAGRQSADACPHRLQVAKMLDNAGLALSVIGYYLNGVGRTGFHDAPPYSGRKRQVRFPVESERKVTPVSVARGGCFALGSTCLHTGLINGMNTDDKRATDAWIEWKRRCAYDLCGNEAKAYLREFAVARFRKWLDHCACSMRVSARQHETMPGRDTWHLLETRMTTGRDLRGKHYKDWLFRRVQHSKDSPLDVIQGGATLVMREAVRDLLRQEAAPGWVQSLSQPLSGSAECDLVLEDVLAGGANPADLAALREYDTIAVAHAGEVFKDMTHKERMAVLAKKIGLSVACEALERAAGCRKSRLSELYRQFAGRVGKFLKSRYSGEDMESLLTLALMIMDRVSEEVVRWARAESACACLFATSAGSARNLGRPRAGMVAEASPEAEWRTVR